MTTTRENGSRDSWLYPKYKFILVQNDCLTHQKEMCAMSSNCGWTHTWMHLPNTISQSLTVWLTKTIEVFSFKFWNPDVRLQSMNGLCVFVGLVMVHLHFHPDDSASPKHTHLKLSVSFNWEGVTLLNMGYSPMTWSLLLSTKGIRVLCSLAADTINYLTLCQDPFLIMRDYTP